jgi:hypothetical protein
MFAIFMKWKVKQWWSTIPSISTKRIITSHHISLNIKTRSWHMALPTRGSVLDTTLCVKVCQWLETGRWFSLCLLVSSTNKTDRQEITKILVKVVFNTIKQKQTKHCLIHHNSTMVDTNLGTDCIGSYKSNYLTIAATTTPLFLDKIPLTV